jgi:hypothetical protein
MERRAREIPPTISMRSLPAEPPGSWVDHAEPDRRRRPDRRPPQGWLLTAVEVATQILAAEAVDDLRAALNEFAKLADELAPATVSG